MPGFEFIGKEEKEEILQVIESGVLMRYGFDGMRNGHWKSKELESALTQTFHASSAHLVSSGTAAVTTAMAVAGVGAGDEVIMPSFTFVASFEAILQLGAIPILVDIDETLTLCPKSVQKAITSKTKAIMPVHMCGSVADMKALREICDKHNLLLIEDASQAIGATSHGKPVGSIGDLGCLSLDFVKTITCGEGGAILSPNKELVTQAAYYSDHGHDHIGNDRGAEIPPFMGFNYRISELHSAVGLAQIKKLPKILEIQHQYLNILKSYVVQSPKVTLRPSPEGTKESGAFLNFSMPSLEETRNVIKSFNENGVDGCFHYYDNNWHYIRAWNHLKNAKTLYPLSEVQYNAIKELREKSFAQSDAVIGRNISCLIKLNWSEKEVHKRGEKMLKLIEK